ncbi:hypothetical protein TNCV_2616571 [Trichonephila clavipes]|nr:hypothetical protein TNCV_2616571 [Trichonephila clavipes]
MGKKGDLSRWEELSPKRKKKCGRKPIFTPSGKGTGRLYEVKGMVWQDQYKDILQNRLILQLEEWFPNGKPYIVMQDGASFHTARYIKAFLAEQNIPLSFGLAR